MEILRKYCLNDNPVKLQVLSDQAANFPTKCARRRAHPPLPNRIQRAADRSDLALSLNELESGATQAPPPRARLAQTLRVPLITISVFLPHALSPFSLTAVPHSVAAFFPTRQVRHGEVCDRSGNAEVALRGLLDGAQCDFTDFADVVPAPSVALL